MDKKTKVLLAATCIIAAFLLFAIFRSFTQVKKSPADNIAPIEIIKNESENLSCKNLTSAYLQQQCYTDAAVKTANASFCGSEIYENGAVYYSEWKGSCYQKVALQTGNYSNCDLVPLSNLTSPDNCYLNVAFETKDKNICRKIKDNSTRDYCFSYKMLSER